MGIYALDLVIQAERVKQTLKALSWATVPPCHYPTVLRVLFRGYVTFGRRGWQLLNGSAGLRKLRCISSPSGYPFLL
jgi:hypothetical protein